MNVYHHMLYHQQVMNTAHNQTPAETEDDFFEPQNKPKTKGVQSIHFTNHIHNIGQTSMLKLLNDGKP
jgi:hypothetical protein